MGDIADPTNPANKAVVDLQAVIDEQRQKLEEAEKMTQAVIEEFTNCNDFDDVRQTFRDQLKKFAPQALLNIIKLANSAESESVQAGLNKWVLDWVMSDKIDGSAGELGSLLKQLQKPAATTTTGSNDT